MPRALFTQNIDNAFEERVGAAGASRTRFQALREALNPAISHIASCPTREAAPIFSLPSRVDDLAEIEEIATYIAQQFTALVVVGMGGSSLSGEVLAYLRPQGAMALHVVDNIDPHTLSHLSHTLPWERTAFLVVSKSGNTVETLALMGALLGEAAARGMDASRHFFVITIANHNPLHSLALSRGMRVIVHDTDLGGRFSLFSAVGLIPAAALGVDIRAVRAGASLVLAENFASDQANAADAAALHVALMEKSVGTHLLMHYSDRLAGLAAWYRQCWSESLGKQGRGTLPVPSRGVTDQHGQLQLYLEGPKDKFLTALVVDSSGQGSGIGIPDSEDARLDYLKGHTLGDLALAEQQATNATLIQAGCPVRRIVCPQLNAATLGGLLMHFMLEVIFTAELLGVNAFDQPAVEAGKKRTLDYLRGK